MLAASLVMQLALAPAQPPVEGPLPAVRTHPREPMSALLTNNDYPMAAEQFHATADVYYRVFVRADGSVSDCRIYRQNQIVEFGRLTCDIMRRRAHFEPARDAEGNAVPDVFDGHFVFRMEGPDHNRRHPHPRN